MGRDDPPHRWDHDHCEFCGAKFEAAEQVAARQPADASILIEGYVTIDSQADNWICDRCFGDFKDEFNWSVRQA